MELKRKKQILFWSGFGAVFVLFLIFLSFVSIYSDVKATCLHARRPGADCLDNLVYIIQAPQADFKQKNTAVWALGQLADRRAQMALFELNEGLTYDGQRCDYANEICKSEVEKALRWCLRGNLTHWMYRGRAWTKPLVE